MGQTFSSCVNKSPNKKPVYQPPKTTLGKVFIGPPDSYLVISKYKYNASGDTDISFEAKEYMYVTKEYDEFWLEVVKCDDEHVKGLVPSNYVSKQDGSPQSIEGWREIQRWEAEKLLMRVGLRKGTYIVRPSKKENCFALSVRDFDEKKKIHLVKNFQIKIEMVKNEITYYINVRGFSDMIVLIKYYEKNGIGCSHIPLTDPLSDDYQPPIHFQDIEINRENIDLLNEIGRGCFGSVYKAKWGRSYEVAAKMMQSNKADKEKFLFEAKIMHKLRHRKIVELLGVCTEPADMPMMIVVEYMKNGSLKEFLKTTIGKQTKLGQMIPFMADISEGMAYLEGKNVVHRDLRADNVLVADDLSVKVADFGLTELVDKEEDTEKKNLRFPVKWTSPESAKSKIFTSKTDVWSFGIVIYEILTWGSSPYPDIPAKEVIEKISKGYRMPNPQLTISDVKCPDDIYEVMLKCWSQEPNDRPSFAVLQDTMDNLIIAPTYDE